MINAVNNINFKGILYGGHRDFSEPQKKVADDIKTKLGKKAEKNDFLIKALADDIVELSEVYNVKKVGTGINKEIEYSKGVYIGKYDEKHPFELEDYNYAVKEKAKGFRALMFLALVYVGTFTGLFNNELWIRSATMLGASTSGALSSRSHVAAACVSET